MHCQIKNSIKKSLFEQKKTIFFPAFLTCFSMVDTTSSMTECGNAVPHWSHSQSAVYDKDSIGRR